MLNLRSNLSAVNKLRKKISLKGTGFAAFIGIFVGLFSYVFSYLVELSQNFFLHDIAGYRIPHLTSSGSFHLFHFNPYLLFIPVVGAIFSSFLVYTFAPEAEGHGTDQVIHSFHKEEGKIRAHVPFIKAIATALTLGSGGSAGKEGPVAQIGAGLGSSLASFFKLSERERRIFLLAGTGAGLGAVFKSPLGGAIFAAEVLYRSSEFEASALPIIMVASITSYAVMGLISSWNTIFITPHYRFSMNHTIFFALMGFTMIPFAYLYIKFFEFCKKLFSKISPAKFLSPIIGAVALGILISFFSPVASSGYGWIQNMLDEKVGLEFLIIFAFAKIVATGFTIGSGGSGGVYAPSLGIGAAFGGAFGVLIKKIFPGLDISVGAFSLVGMGSFFACAAKVPLATIIMIAEMTGGYDLLVPITAASFFSFFFSGNWSIYESQVYSRRESPAHRDDFIVDVLEEIKVNDVIALPQKIPFLKPEMRVKEVLKIAKDSPRESFPVLKGDGTFGMIYMNDLRSVLYSGEIRQMRNIVLVEDIMRDDVPFLKPDDNLHTALKYFIRKGVEDLPVISEKGEFLGTISHGEIIGAYEDALNNL